MPILLEVRGIGADRDWNQRLGDLSVDGVGFDFPRPPEAQDFEVRFCLPGEAKSRAVLATVVDRRERGHYTHVGAKILGADEQDIRAIARSLDQRRSGR